MHEVQYYKCMSSWEQWTPGDILSDVAGTKFQVSEQSKMSGSSTSVKVHSHAESHSQDSTKICHLHWPMHGRQSQLPVEFGLNGTENKEADGQEKRW